MNVELKKRIITSICLLILLTIMFYYTFVLIISLVLLGVISWIEFYALISKIFKNNNYKDKTLRFLCKSSSLLYISSLVYFIIVIKSKNSELEFIVVYAVMISIFTDTGGLIFGKIFKGKKLTNISPKKTISGSVGSFIFSLFLLPFFIKYFVNYNIFELLLITMLISLISQLGDLFISFLKRKAKVKDTSDLLPGHGGILDRIDGIIFSIPIALILLN
ncbi:phosphatidate cytidylyltransferase [Candidatus Pelagibacter sp.]|nr:phosphatidate cytidylyltransferase [Candidatus Pelagibacter sp.]